LPKGSLSGRDQDLGEVGIAGRRSISSNRGGGILVRYDDRGLEARLRRVEGSPLPVVHGDVMLIEKSIFWSPWRSVERAQMPFDGAGVEIISRMNARCCRAIAVRRPGIAAAARGWALGICLAPPCVLRANPKDWK
jgi:hypothetical protein